MRTDTFLGGLLINATIFIICKDPPPPPFFSEIMTIGFFGVFFYKYCVHVFVLLFIYAYSYVGFKTSLELVL